jgi:hypothetical protein
VKRLSFKETGVGCYCRATPLRQKSSPQNAKLSGIFQIFFKCTMPVAFFVSIQMNTSMRIIALIGFLLMSMAGMGFAQSGKRNARDSASPSSVDQGSQQDEYKIFRGSEYKKSKRSKGKLTFTEQKVKEYEDRQEANAKRYREQAKEMEKPKYSDPAYFGHDRKPKKRAPGKKKFCKQCGIKH